MAAVQPCGSLRLIAMTTTRPSLLDLHPIEVLLLVFLLSIASIARLINDPPATAPSHHPPPAAPRPSCCMIGKSWWSSSPGSCNPLGFFMRHRQRNELRQLGA
jgi:hypothetical protein